MLARSSRLGNRKECKKPHHRECYNNSKDNAQLKPRPKSANKCLKYVLQYILYNIYSL